MRSISNSELRSFRRCRRRWWLSYVRRLELNRPDVVGARALGTRVHRALERYYETVPFDRARALLTISADWLDDVARIVEWAGTDEVRQRQWETLLPDATSEVELAQLMVDGYIDWVEETGVDANLEVLGVEVEVAAPLNARWQLVGKLDQVVRDKRTGFTAFLDHKTVGNLTDLPKTAQMNEQGLTYCVLRRLTAPADVFVDGELINMLRKVKRTARARPPFYGRHEVRWNREQLNNYYARVLGLVAAIQAVHDLLARGWDHQAVVYPNPTRDCAWDCDFYPICPMFDDGSRVEDAIQMHYRTHDPLARYGSLPRNEESE